MRNLTDLFASERTGRHLFVFLSQRASIDEKSFTTFIYTYNLSWYVGVNFNVMRFLSEEMVVLDSNNVCRAFLISKRHEFCDR